MKIRRDGVSGLNDAEENSLRTKENLQIGM